MTDKPVVANNMTFPNLGSAVEYLHGDLGVEEFTYVPTTMGPVQTPNQDQVIALMEKALHDLNPEAEVNRVLFSRFAKECSMQAATLASALLKQAKENPTNVAIEGAQTWRIEASAAPDAESQVVDLMANLEKSVADAKASRERSAQDTVKGEEE